MMRSLLAPPLTAVLLVASGPGMADEIREQIELAIEFYEEGDLAAAVTELQFAIGELQAKQGGAYALTMPPAPDGWTADEPSQETGTAFMGGGTIVNRAYSEDGGQGRMEAQIVVDNPMLQGMAALFSNPAMLAANPGMQRVRIGRDNAVMEFDEANGRGEITYLLGGGRVMLKVSGNSLRSGDQLVDLLNAWDMDSLKSVAGL